MLSRLLLLSAALVVASWQPSAAAAGWRALGSSSSITVRGLLEMPLKTCYDDNLPLEASLPTISSDIKAFVLTQAQLNLDSNSVQHLRCQQGQLKRPPSRWPKAWPSSQLQFQPTDAAAWQQAQSRCNHTYQGLSVAIERGTPLKHFGHRMLTDLAALWTAKVWLTDNGVDVSHVRVVYTDNMGKPAWGPDNFRPILESLGFKSYEPRVGPMLCFEEVIFMPIIYSPKWYKAAGSDTMMYMWQAPEMLYDTNDQHIKLLMNIREHGLGLPARIPFAPATNRTVVLASRDPEIRKRSGFRAARLLMNEAELVAALRTIPDIHVQQVELGTMPMLEVVQLLERTSLFLGYHGAGFDNLVFLPRGASVLEILPKGTIHSPLYPSLAHRTGKEFARYVNDNDARQAGRLDHSANLVVDVDAIMKLVKAMLRVQQAAMMRYSFDENV